MDGFSTKVERTLTGGGVFFPLLLSTVTLCSACASRSGRESRFGSNSQDARSSEYSCADAACGTAVSSTNFMYEGKEPANLQQSNGNPRMQSGCPTSDCEAMSRGRAGTR